MSRGLPDALIDDLAKIQQKTAGSANVDLTSEQRAILASDDVNVLKAELTKAFRTINDAFGGSMMQMETVKPLMGRPRPKVKQEDASNPYQDADFREMSQRARKERASHAAEGVFSLFARIDTDKSGYLDAEELHAALESDPSLQRRLGAAVGITTDEALHKIEKAVVGRMDEDWDGKITANEFERILTGRTDWGVAITSEEREQRRLAGAAARAQQRAIDGGGFQGLSAEEALRVGEAAAHVGSAAAVSMSFQKESDPTKFADGAYYVTNPEAREARRLREAEIRQLEHDEYTYKEDFKGLSAEEALKVGEASRHYGKGVALHYEGTQNQESRPEAFADGAHYSTDAEAAAQRAARIEEIHELEHEEYTYKEDFKGLDNSEAERIGAEAARIAAEKPAEMLSVELDDEATRKKKEKMKARMEKRLAARHTRQKVEVSTSS